MTAPPKRKVRQRVVSLLVLVLLGFGGWKVAELAANAREQAVRSHCNLGQLKLAFANYCDVYGELPPATVFDVAGKPLYSWRVLLVEFIDSNLYDQFHLNEAWDSEHNVQLISKMPGTYKVPWKQVVDAPDDHTVCRVFTGPGTLFEGGLSLENPEHCPDGFESTLLMVEAGEPIPWSKPGDFEFVPDRPILLKGAFKGKARAITSSSGYRYLIRIPN